METLGTLAKKHRKAPREFADFLAGQRELKIVWQPRGQVAARINHGRWLADCPFCSGAELVDPEDAFFFCFSCGMQKNQGQIMKVKFPTARRKIEKLLEKRPEAATKNWSPGETMEQLEWENKLYEVK